MIAAGHPDLTFELNLFSAVMPRHWKDSPTMLRGSECKEWAVGGRCSCEQSGASCSPRPQSTWPEYAELDCFACHHSLTTPKTVGVRRSDMMGRTPGVPAWNSARFVVFRYAAAETELLHRRQTRIGAWQRSAV